MPIHRCAGLGLWDYSRWIGFDGDLHLRAFLEFYFFTIFIGQNARNPNFFVERAGPSVDVDVCLLGVCRVERRDDFLTVPGIVTDGFLDISFSLQDRAVFRLYLVMTG